MIVEIDNSENSMANQMVHFWRGEPLDRMSKDELISIIVDQARMAEAAHTRHAETFEFIRTVQRARKRRWNFPDFGQATI